MFAAVLFGLLRWGNHCWNHANEEKTLKTRINSWGKTVPIDLSANNNDEDDKVELEEKPT